MSFSRLSYEQKSFLVFGELFFSIPGVLRYLNDHLIHQKQFSAFVLVELIKNYPKKMMQSCHPNLFFFRIMLITKNINKVPHIAPSKFCFLLLWQSKDFGNWLENHTSEPTPNESIKIGCFRFLKKAVQRVPLCESSSWARYPIELINWHFFRINSMVSQATYFKSFILFSLVVFVFSFNLSSVMRFFQFIKIICNKMIN